VDLGVPTLDRIEVDHDFAAHPGLTDQGCHRFTERWGVLQHPQAKHLVEAVVGEGQLVDRDLGQLKALAIGSAVAPVGINGTGVIHAVQHAGGGAQNHLAETAGATTNLQQRAMAKLLGIPAGFGIEALLAQIHTGVHIQLGAIKMVPLESEAFGVVVGRAKAGNAPNYLIMSSIYKIRQIINFFHRK